MYVAPARRVTDPYPASDGSVGGVALDDREADHRSEMPSGPHEALPGDDSGSGGSRFGRGRRSGDGRKGGWRRLLVNVLAVVALLMTGAILLQNDGPADAGVTAGTRLSRTGKLVITKDGTVIEGRDVRGPIYIKADNVTIRDSRVEYGGDFLIRIYPGFTGTLIEDVDIVCPKSTKGSAVAFGRYTAKRVDVTRCKNAFLTTGGDVRVTNSLWNGQEVSIGAGDAWSQQPMPTTTTAAAPKPAAPVAPPSPVTTESPTPTTPPATAAPAPSAPSPGGFPSAADTGPTTTNLAASGSKTITQNGAVVENLRINGTLTIQANDVTIRNVLIENTDTYPIRATEASNLLVEDTEIDGNGEGNVAVYGGSYTLRRVDIHDTLDGPRIEGDNVLIEDSFIHDLHRVPDGHHDIIQIRNGNNIQIRNNTLTAFNARTNDPMNAAIQIGGLNGPLSGLVVENNYMDGGNFTVNAAKNGSSLAVFRNNTLGDNARYGPLSSGGALQWVGNVFAGGAPAT
jgi:hypothetical protein